MKVQGLQTLEFRCAFKMVEIDLRMLSPESPFRARNRIVAPSNQKAAAKSTKDIDRTVAKALSQDV
jgi:hypothetical protein